MSCKFPLAGVAGIAGELGKDALYDAMWRWHFAKRGRGLEATPHYRHRPLSFNTITKAKSKPAPKARLRVHPAELAARGRSSRSRAQPHALPGKPWKRLNTQKAGAGRGSGAQQSARREGADYLQAAGWQCPLLAAPACQQDNGTEQSWGPGHPCAGSAPSTWWEGARAGGKQSGRLLGSRLGHGSDSHPGTPVSPETASQVPKSLWKHLNLKRS